MITLENIGITELNKGLGNTNNPSLENLQQLKELLQTKKDSLQYNENIQKLLFSILKETESKIQKSPKKDPIIYSVNKYEEVEELSWNDSRIDGSVLITDPTVSGTILSSTLRNMTITEIKYLLSHTDIEGNNLLSNLKGVGPYRVQKLLPLLTMYDEQLMRQYQEKNEKEAMTPIFYL